MKSNLILLSFLLLWFSKTTVLACSCGYARIADAYRYAELIFSAEVIEINEISSSEFIRIKRISLKTQTIFKGEINSDTLHIYTKIGNGDCGYPFIEGQTYIIYAQERKHEGEQYYWTDVCTRTQEYNETEAQGLEKLREEDKK